MHRTALAQLAFLATSVHAFFPYIPNYACTQFHGCGELDKRELSAEGNVVREVESTELLTLKLFQRVTPGKRDPPAAAARQAGRLRRKYGSADTSPTSTSPESSLKRDNNFSIDKAETPTATNSVGIDQDGSDISYFVQARIGSSDTEVYLLCDTGAGATWVMGSNCDSTACGEHTTWTPTDSTSYKDAGEGFSIAYGTGTVEGELAQDSITIGSVEITMEFGVANTTSDDFTHFAFDGILGLSMASGATDNFIDSVKSDKALTSNIFSVDLNRASDGTNTGELTFGGTNSAKYSGDITYTSVDSSAGGHWAVPLDDMAYDGTKAGVTGKLAYLDTGTSYAFGPSDDVAALHKLIPGATSEDGVTYTAPCDTDLPIALVFSGVNREISVKDWLSAADTDGTCTSNIYGREAVTGAFLFGDVFLKNVYTVFDADASRVGLASKANGTTTSTSSSSSSTSTSASSSTSSDQGTASATSAMSTSSTSSSSASASATGTGIVTSSSGARFESRGLSNWLGAVAFVALVAF